MFSYFNEKPKKKGFKKVEELKPKRNKKNKLKIKNSRKKWWWIKKKKNA